MIQLPIFILGGVAAVLIHKTVEKTLDQSKKPINNNTEFKKGVVPRETNIEPVDPVSSSGGDHGASSQLPTEQLEPKSIKDKTNAN